jgi:chromosomal replication initiation ATPase DnaA
MGAQLALDLRYPADYGIENFLVTPVNQEAYAWITRWPHWSHQFLALYGPPGCGKTHMAHLWSATALWLDTAHYSQSPHATSQMAPMFVLDNPQCDDTWLFHFYNLCQEEGRYVLICHLHAPHHWAVTLPDLQSRLSTIPAIGMGEPDSELMTQLIHKLFRERGVAIHDVLAAYLLNRVERSVTVLKTLVYDIDAYALSLNRPISLKVIRDFLGLMDPHAGLSLELADDTTA